MRFCLSIILVSFLLPISIVRAQNNEIPYKKEVDHNLEGWFGLYTKYRIGKKLFYYGEYHYRRRNSLKDMGQVYLRYGVTYLHSKKLELTAGLVTPLYWAPDQNKKNIDKVVPQYRLWQQALFVMPFNRAKVYHQLRTEQRWKRDFEKHSPFKLSLRFRYKLSTYIPLNNYKLISKTLFLSIYEEIFFQAGKTVIYDHLEDNRLFIGLGYIFNQHLQVQAGYMWTYRHAGSPYKYEHRHIPRISLYHNFDFYKKRKQKKRQEVNKILENEF